VAEGSLGWDGRLARLKEEETESRGGAASLLFWPSGGGRVFRKDGFVGLKFFLCFFLMFQNCPHPFWCMLKATIYRQNVAWPQNCSLNFLFL